MIILCCSVSSLLLPQIQHVGCEEKNTTNMFLTYNDEDKGSFPVDRQAGRQTDRSID